MSRSWILSMILIFTFALAAGVAGAQPGFCPGDDDDDETSAFCPGDDDDDKS